MGSLEDKAGHTADQARGKTKDVVGRATGNRDMQNEGRVELVLGNLKQAGEKVIDAMQAAMGRK